jgi:lipopolysaccharide/colanic/teichoic acid biosynthesis glycosyltransferase
MTYASWKRASDAVVSLVMLILGLPLWIVIAVGIKVTSRGPVLYRQERAGVHGHPFVLYKFRSMRVGNAGDGRLHEADSRITPFGAIIRRWSLDELPQLINILRGDMSFVGPRPTMVEQIDHYSQEQFQRLAVRPGLTGLAQVSGRNSIPWERRIELDLVYVDRLSFMNDLSIVIRTLPAALRSSGVYAYGGNLPFTGIGDGLVDPESARRDPHDHHVGGDASRHDGPRPD